MTRRAELRRVLGVERPFFTSRARVPARPWGRRLAEIGRMCSIDTERWVAWVLFLPLFVPIGVVGLLARPERWTGSVAFVVLGTVGAYALVRLADERAQECDALDGLFAGPAMTAAASRYRMAVVAGDALPTEVPFRPILRGPIAIGRRFVPLGGLDGAVRGRRCIVAGRRTKRGEVRSWLLGAAELRRPALVHVGPGGRLGSGAIPDATFDQVLRADGPDADHLPEALRAWLAATCREVEFEAVGEWLFGRRTGPWHDADPAAVGVLLAAVVGFADRWEAG